MAQISMHEVAPYKGEDSQITVSLNRCDDLDRFLYVAIVAGDNVITISLDAVPELQRALMKLQQEGRV